MSVYPGATKDSYSVEARFIAPIAGAAAALLVEDSSDTSEKAGNADPISDESITDALARHARERPEGTALILPTRTDDTAQRLTWSELNDRTSALARGLLRLGLRPGDRCVLMVRPGEWFFPLAYGMLRAGIVPVLIDPGMGLRSLGRCLAEAAPVGFVGEPEAHLAALVLGWGRATVRHRVTTRRSLLGGPELSLIASRGAQDDRPLPTPPPDAPAAVLFTSGSTGVAKGVLYRHRHFAAQARLLRDTYGIGPGEVDLPTFAPFALFDLALGMTCVLPPIDFTRPGSVDAQLLTRLIHAHGVTNVFGSPAALASVARTHQRTPLAWPTVRRVLSAGAPMPVETLARLEGLLPAGAAVHTPYGATECLPVSTISSDELAETRRRTLDGHGVCVGRVVSPNDVRIIPLTDAPLRSWQEMQALPVGEVGEVTVCGPTTTDSYFGRPEADTLAKVRRPDGATVHRMGDIGYLDTEGRLWFCGRKTQRVALPHRTLHTAMVEEPLNALPGVRRTALVGVRRGGRTVPVLCVERDETPPRTLSDAALLESVRQHAAALEATQELEHFLLHPRFPVDIRHNAKIGRERLAVWAAEQLG